MLQSFGQFHVRAPTPPNENPETPQNQELAAHDWYIPSTILQFPPISKVTNSSYHRPNYNAIKYIVQSSKSGISS